MSGGSILAYARHHGLAIDHQANYPTLDPQSLLQHNFTAFHDNPTSSQDIQLDLVHLTSDTSDILTEPRLKLTVIESRLLSSAISKPVLEIPLSNSAWQRYLPIYRLKQKLKLQLPLLIIGGGDVDKDVGGVKKGIDLDLVLQDVRDQWDIDNGDEYAKMKAEDDADINGLLETGGLFLDRMREEKVQVNKKVLCLLGEAIRCENMRGSVADVPTEHFPNRRRESFTKSPTVLSIDDFVDETSNDSLTHDAEENNEQRFAHSISVQLKSEDSKEEMDLLNAGTEAMESECQTAEEDIISQEWIEAAIAIPCLGAKKGFLEVGSDCEMNMSGPVHKRRKIAHDLKMDVPLFVSSSPKGRHTIYDDTCDAGAFDIGSPIQKLLKTEPCDDEDFVLTQDTVESFDKELIKLSDQAAAEVRDLLATESLSPSLMLTKMRVPDVPSGSSSANLDDMSSKSLIDQYLTGRVRTVTLDRKQELALNWLPFAILSLEHASKEPFSNTSAYLKKVTAPPEKIVRSDQLLWKGQGLLILEGEDEDVEILELSSESDDCSSLEISTETDSQLLSVGALQQTELMNTSNHAHTGGQFQTPSKEQSREPSKKQISYDEKSMQGTRPVSMGHISAKLRCQREIIPKFSASSSLSSFLELRGRKFVKPKNFADHIARESSQDPIQRTQESDRDVTKNSTADSTNNTNDSGDHLKLLCLTPGPFLPPIDSLHSPRTIVANNMLLQSRPSLISYLENQGGSKLTIIYRDLDPKFEGCPDLILSPTTAITYTNTQLLAQRPLPGQNKPGGLSPAHQNISRLTASFDDVIVIIIQNTPTTVMLSSTDSIIITQFVAFCALLSRSNSQVRVLRLEHNHQKILDDAIHTWTWSCISRYSFPSPSFPHSSKFVVSHTCFIQEETLWELFLRKAGMNTFAAQLVLGSMKRPEDSTGSKNSRSTNEICGQAWGLSRFVSMCPEKRLELFGSMLGRRSIMAFNDVVENHV